MKILHINDHYQRIGGAEVLLFNMLDVLEKNGDTNVVVYQHAPGQIPPHRRAYQIAGLGDVRILSNAHVRSEVVKVIQTEKPDLIHIHDIGNPQIAKIALRFAPVLQSVFNHSFYCPGGQKYLPSMRVICEKKLGLGCFSSAFSTHCNSVRPNVLFLSYLRSHRMMQLNRDLQFLVLSQYQFDELIKNGCPPENIQILSPFTDIPQVSEMQEETPEKILLFTGRITKQKGLTALLKAVKSIQSSFRLIVDGDGPALEEAKIFAREAGLNNKVSFVGWASPADHSQNYRKASVVIVPSLWPEPFGMVGIEAMSYGKPVVAFDVGGIPEWLEEGKTGFLIPSGDLKQMAEKIEILLNQPDLSFLMGQEGKKKVEAEFSRGIFTSRLLKIYEKALATHHRNNAA